MDFSQSDDLRSIQELARQIFAGRLDDEARKRFDRQQSDWHAELWQLLAESGLIGVALREEQGGSGLGFSELCAVIEEQGRHVAALPLLSTLVLGALPLARFGTAAQCTQWLPRVSAGSALLSSCLWLSGAPVAAYSLPRCTAEGASWRLDGELGLVPYGREADALLVPALDASAELQFFVVARATSGMSSQRQRGTNHEPLDIIEFTALLVSDADRLGVSGEGETIARWIAERAATALGFLQLGVLEEALRRTALHTVERKQFGKALAGFQAVAHRAADAYIDIEALRATLCQSAWRLDQGLPAENAVAVASWWACQAGHRVGHACQHLHGGTGADLEYPIHRYFLWAKQIELSLGGGSRILAGLGAGLSTQQIEIGL